VSADGRRAIRVSGLSRVEGEGGLEIRIEGGAVTQVRLRITEPPRLFEALLAGRPYADAPDITARICGICPIAYMLSAAAAMEDAFAVAIPAAVRDLRRLIYCGEWIQSHTLHAAFLHAPDLAGVDDAFALARREPALVQHALALKKLGNRIMEVVGGRAVHPVNLRIGGFYKAPDRAAVRALVGPLEDALDRARALARAFSRFDFPELAQDYLFVSLRDDARYPIEAGRIVTSAGDGFPVAAFRARFHEHQVAHSTALHGRTADGAPYLVGPLARYANNHDRLTPAARVLAAEIGLGAVCTNPYRSILVRLVEVAVACEEARRLAAAYQPAEPAAAAIVAGEGTGHGATEAPRGICYHRYRLGAAGTIADALIVPPTAQNQPRIEADLRAVVEANLGMADEALRRRCEHTIRTYDPCISCATHKLTVRLERR
jgi:coenzyme F420-reducing hydrogenase alpha subunit